jgi:N utilization substance protein B
MKTAKDPRHIKRIKAVKALFASSFTDQDSVPSMAKEVLAQKGKLDKKIQEAAPVWPVDKLKKIDLAMLSLAIYELENTKTPPKVVIDEAVEIAKEFGSESSPSFVNGVLGTIYKDKVEEKPNKDE